MSGTVELAWEIGKFVYSVGLLVLGFAIIAAAPVVLRVLRDLTAALIATAAGLRATLADKDTIDQLRDAVARIEQAQAADSKTLEEIKLLVERCARRARPRTSVGAEARLRNRTRSR